MREYSFNEFLKDLDLNDEVKNIVLNNLPNISFSSFEKEINDLQNINTAECAYLSLLDKLEDDDKHFKLFVIYLETARRVYQTYLKKGIDKAIYLSTMRVLPRYLAEGKSRFGYYIFDVAGFAYKELAMTIFNLGGFEFELESFDTINLHIPPRSDIRVDNVLKNIREMKRFVNIYFPEYRKAKFGICSWLLAKKLNDILPQDSNIIKFQQMFDIRDEFLDNMGYIVFIFKVPTGTPITELKANTTLQKGVLDCLKKDIKVGIAFGYLKEEYASMIEGE